MVKIPLFSKTTGLEPLVGGSPAITIATHYLRLYGIIPGIWMF